tara:strand:+ start:1795 stop:2649 length:855 start_codon:yes stop_codon:yes gene_type:complete
MKIKHSKYRNTGLIFELLVKQIAADTLDNKDSKAIDILKKFYSNKSTLAKEYKLYEFLSKNNKLLQSKAEAVLSTITEVSRKLDQKTLKAQKYELISEIKKDYNLEEFFGMEVRNYKPLAALYCLLEAQNNSSLVDPQFLVDNKFTILEHLTSNPQEKEAVKDSLIEDYSKYDKDLKMLTFKILLEKFNDKYRDLLPEQKNILKEFITSVNSNRRLYKLVNREFENILKEVNQLVKKVKDDVVKIKLQEVVKSITPLTKTEKVNDTHLVNLMQYYDLVNELKNL